MPEPAPETRPVPLLNVASFSEELATKLLEHQVLFYSGAGLSVNWGVPLGGTVAERLRERFKELVPDLDVRTRALLDGIAERDLPMVSELVGQNKCWYIHELIVPDVTHPPAQSPLGLPLAEMLRTDPVHADRTGVPQIVLARLAKEGLISELLTTNVDCLHEAACEAVGMVPISEERNQTALAFPWPEAYRVVADRSDHAQLWPERNLFTIHKIHGCLEKVRTRVRQHTHDYPDHHCHWNTESPDKKCQELSQDELNFVFTYRELLNWRKDHWARDLLADRVRNHHVVFSGFALADTVSHATFRDIFEEVIGPTPVKLGSGDTTNKATRAQMISANLNLQTAAVLVAANRRDPFGDEKHVAEVGTSRKKLEDLFRAVYARSMVKLLQRQIKLRGPSVLSGWVLGPDSAKERFTRVHKASDEVQAYLSLLVDTPEFLYDALPAVVRLAWLATDRLIEWGIPEGGSRSPYLPRFISPNYYVPLGQALELTMLMLQAFRLLLADKPPGEAATVLPNGWVRFSASDDHSARAVLPLLAPTPGNLPLLSRLRSLQPPPRTDAGLLIITPNGTPESTSNVLGAFARTSLGAAGALAIQPITCGDLWQQGALALVQNRLKDAQKLPIPRKVS